MSDFIDLLLAAMRKVAKPQLQDYEIVVMHYGLDGTGVKTQKEIAEALHISSSDVSDREHDLLDRLRKKALQDRRDELNSACAQVFNAIQKPIAQLEGGFYEQAFYIIAHDLGELMPVASGMRLLNNLTHLSLTERLTQMQDYYRAQGGVFYDLKSDDTSPISYLLDYVVWASHMKSWRVEQFQGKAPALMPDKGQIYSGKLQRNVGYYSNFERQFIEQLEVHPAIVYYLERPFKIDYTFENAPKAYYPDFFFLLGDGRGVVVDLVQTFDMGSTQNFAKWRALQDYCEQKNMGMLITNGKNALQEIENYPVSPEFEHALLRALEVEGCIQWRTYKLIRDRYQAKSYDLVALIIKHEWEAQQKPFMICKAHPKSD